MTFFRIPRAMVLGLALAGTAASVALAASAGDTISARQANFKTMGKAMKGSFEEMKQSTPSLAVLGEHAKAIAEAAAKVKGFFPKGSGPEAGVKTQALPAIWQKGDEFGADADKLVKAATAYQQAAASGNLDAVKAALPGLGQACKGCHETFRAKDT